MSHSKPRNNALADFDVITGAATPIRPIAPPSLPQPAVPALPKSGEHPGAAAVSGGDAAQPEQR
jgi:hypothetical protein